MKTYESPRWTGEILDCSMPMTFDTYNKCSYNCLYCFSYFQKSHYSSASNKIKNYNYQKSELGSVNIEKIKKLFLLDNNIGKGLKQFFPYIKNKKVMQWGGLADQFDEYERKHGVTLELLKFFKQINYPLCFSTKGIWWIYDDRYRSLFYKQDNWNTKISIINLDTGRAKKMEKGVKSPTERLQAISELVKLNNAGVTLRLRPFIIGLSDKNSEYLELIKQACSMGANAVSTEFFCMEGRADERLKDRYRQMSEIIGFDIYDFYKKYTTYASGYMRLNKNIKLKYTKKMKALCDNLGMRFYVSDAHNKEFCHNGSCCGLSEEWNYSRGQFTEALIIAKRNGIVKLCDISKDLQMYKGFLWGSASGFNTNSAKTRIKRKNFTMYDYIRNIWNTPNNRRSPYKYFEGALTPVGIDEEKNVIYKYNGECTAKE